MHLLYILLKSIQIYIVFQLVVGSCNVQQRLICIGVFSMQAAGQEELAVRDVISKEKSPQQKIIKNVQEVLLIS